MTFFRNAFSHLLCSAPIHHSAVYLVWSSEWWLWLALLALLLICIGVYYTFITSSYKNKGMELVHFLGLCWHEA